MLSLIIITIGYCSATCSRDLSEYQCCNRCARIEKY